MTKNFDTNLHNYALLIHYLEDEDFIPQVISNYLAVTYFIRYANLNHLDDVEKLKHSVNAANLFYLLGFCPRDVLTVKKWISLRKVCLFVVLATQDLIEMFLNYMVKSLKITVY